MVIVIMGVSGCGKTTIGQLLAKKLEVPFFDADDFHPKENVEKMSSGLPLNDADRQPWLKELSEQINQWKQSKGAVLACSALKQKYRSILTEKSDKNNVRFVYLKGKKPLILQRLQHRSGHYMPPGLLDSQFHDLEEPDDALVVSINQSPDFIVTQILNEIT